MEALTGWGRAVTSVATVRRVTTVAEVEEALAAAPVRGALPRGLGRSYGDQAQNAGGTVLDLTGLDRVLAFDDATGTMRVEAGCSLATVARLSLAAGWFPAVVPGTRFVTVGGAIACDIHGKNHHADGGFAAHLAGLTLVTALGERLALAPGDERFDATAGGLGLTGVVVEATLRLHRVESPLVAMDVDRTEDLDGTLARLAGEDERYRHSVAWVDGAKRGSGLGRAILLRGDHAPAETAGSSAPPPLRGPRISVPRRLHLAPAFRPVLLAAFNEMRWRRTTIAHGRLVSVESFFWPLDGIGYWNRLYGRHGFLQYQCVVPFGREDLVHEVVEALATSLRPPTLVVLKRLGAEGTGHLSFPRSGWTAAFDVPLPAPGLAALLDRLDDRLAEAGGRVYLAKDARMRPALLEAFYPRLAEWRRVRAALDPDGVMASDCARRLALT